MIRKNIEAIRQTIKSCCEKFGRDEKIKLLAVTKNQNLVDIKKALFHGITDIGENRVQEAEAKIPELAGLFSEFHFIGTLQSNKIKKLLSMKPCLIHSVEGLKKAQAISKTQRSLDKNRRQNILLQVNVSNEASKSGVELSTVEKTSIEIAELTNINLVGLMTIGSNTSDKTRIENDFEQMHDIFCKIKSKNIPNVDFRYLSMGMSGDYELALEHGANLLRIGTGIFGSRVK